MWHWENQYVYQKQLENGTHTPRNWELCDSRKLVNFLFMITKSLLWDLLTFDDIPSLHVDNPMFWFTTETDDNGSSSIVPWSFYYCRDLVLILIYRPIPFVLASNRLVAVFFLWVTEGMKEKKEREGQRNSNYPIIPFHRAFRNYVGPFCWTLRLNWAWIWKHWRKIQPRIIPQTWWGQGWQGWLSNQLAVRTLSLYLCMIWND
jgi:hypothetical protein